MISLGSSGLFSLIAPTSAYADGIRSIVELLET